MVEEKQNFKCKFCGFEWIPRIPNPKACTRCKRYFEDFVPASDYTRDSYSAIELDNKLILKLKKIIKFAYVCSDGRTKHSHQEFDKAIMAQAGITTDGAIKRWKQILQSFGFIVSDSVAITFTEKTIKELQGEDAVKKAKDDTEASKEADDFLDSIRGAKNA